MKAGLLTIAALTASAHALAHRRHHLHRRDEDVVNTEVVTVEAEPVVVYVDDQGNVLPDYKPEAKVDTQVNKPAAAPAPAPVAPVAPAPPAPAPPAPAPAAPKSSAPGSKPKGKGNGNGKGKGYGITYSPYNADKTCKSQAQVDADIAKLGDFPLVRLYGTDCHQVTTVKNAACRLGMKLFLGIFDIHNVQAEAKIIIEAFQGDYDCVDTISVGNEVVNSGKGSVAEVVAAVNTARDLLRGAGYTGPVVTVDTFVAVIANPELCHCSDYPAVNIHAFFDGNVAASGAGQFVHDQAKRVSDACGKPAVVTESGWPWSGSANAIAVPSKDNQKQAIDSLKNSFSKDLFLYTAYDDLWKGNFVGSFEAECHWGIIEHSG